MSDSSSARPRWTRTRKSSTELNSTSRRSSRIFSIVFDGQPLDRGQADADVRPLDLEQGAAPVDVRPQDPDPAALGLLDVLGERVIAAAGVDHGRHVRHGMVDFEVDGLVGHGGVRGAVGLVEGVRGEFLHGRPELPGIGRRVAPLAGLLEELLLERLPDAVFLLEGPPQQVALLGRHARRPLGHLHHLLLVKKQPARLGKDLLEEGFAEGLPLLPRPEQGLLHAAFRRAGPDEGQRLGQLVDRLRLHPAEEVHHGRALHLEAADGPGRLEELVGLWRRPAGCCGGRAAPWSRRWPPAPAPKAGRA